MSKHRITPEGLPIVDPKTVEVFFKDEEQRSKEGERSWNDYSQASMSNMQLFNPHIYYMIFSRHTEQLQRDGKDEQSVGYVQGFIAAYELLRRQAEANQMESDF